MWSESIFSDQYNFWQFGYQAVIVTDSAFYRYPHYHDADETPDKLNYETLARVVTVRCPRPL
jgi:hypothetical protein